MRTRTLLVDDSPETLEALKLQYGLHQEVEVLGTARNAAEALRILRSTPIDFVSIDIQLGRDDGFQLCAQVRAQFPHVFVAMCSVEDNELYRSKTTEVGANYFLSKPFVHNDVCMLLDALRDYHNQQDKIDQDNPDWVKELLTDVDLLKRLE